MKKNHLEGKEKNQDKKNSYEMIKKDPLRMEGENVGPKNPLIYDEKTHQK